MPGLFPGLASKAADAVGSVQNVDEECLVFFHSLSFKSVQDDLTTAEYKKVVGEAAEVWANPLKFEFE